jgi:hypothetical protein
MKVASLLFAIVFLISPLFVGLTASAPYDPRYDFDGNGAIDIFDIVDIAGRYGTTGTPVNTTALLVELQARIDELNATLISLMESALIVEDIVLVDNAGTYEIPADYNVADAGTLKIEHLPNLVNKLGGTTQAHVESFVKRLTIQVEAYADSAMTTFSSPCCTVAGTLSEEAGKARWDLEFKNADGSSYSTTDWKLLKVTTYLK